MYYCLWIGSVVALDIPRKPHMGEVSAARDRPDRGSAGTYAQVRNTVVSVVLADDRCVNTSEAKRSKNA